MRKERREGRDKPRFCLQLLAFGLILVCGLKIVHRAWRVSWSPVRPIRVLHEFKKNKQEKYYNNRERSGGREAKIKNKKQEEEEQRKRREIKKRIRKTSLSPRRDVILVRARFFSYIKLSVHISSSLFCSHF